MKFFLEEDINCIFDSLKNKSNKLSGKNILISGGAGFLGTYFVQVINKLNERKFKKPCKVHIIDRFIDKEKKKFLNKNKNFLSGKFLIASPSMLDPVFYKSVIYLISHRSEGAMGIVINQPIVQTKLENIISLEEFKKNKGGPDTTYKK